MNFGAAYVTKMEKFWGLIFLVALVGLGVSLHSIKINGLSDFQHKIFASARYTCNISTLYAIWVLNVFVR